MKTPVKVKDLTDQIGMKGERPILKCFECGAEFSANAGDYFMAKPDYVFECCGEPMSLVVKQVIYK